MSQPLPENEHAAEPGEYPLGADLFSYVALLTRREAGTISFRTGAGRILRDLLLHWPAVEEWENEALELCQRITEAVYPLTGALYAQAVEMEIVISAKIIAAPEQVEAMSTYVLFDLEDKVERHAFLSPKLPLPENRFLSVAKGIAVLCRPLNYRYHTIKDDRKRGRGPGPGYFEMAESLANRLAEANLKPPEQRIIATVKAEIKSLPQTLERVAVAREANLALQTPHVAPRNAPAIAAITSLSALPPPLRALERRLMAYVMNETLSPELRLGLRQIAQNLRLHFPQAVIAEAARQETVPVLVKTAAPEARPLPQPRPLFLAQPVFLARPDGRPQAPAPAAQVKTPPTPATPRLMPTPLSVHPSLRVPTPQLPVPQVSSTIGKPSPQPQQAPAPRQQQRQTLSRAEQPAPQPARRPEARPSPQTARAETQPQAPQQARQSNKLSEQRPAPQVEAKATQHSSSRQRGSELSPEPRRDARAAPQPPVQRERFRPTPDKQPQKPESKFARQSAEHLPEFIRRPFPEMEIRPRGFYDTLAKPFPKNPALDATQKLDKTIAPKPAQSLVIRPSLRIKPPVWKLDTPAPIPMPFLFKGRK